VWCQENNLYLNVNKTYELIVDYRKRRAEHIKRVVNRTRQHLFPFRRLEKI
jgi:hypothetical protein